MLTESFEFQMRHYIPPNKNHRRSVFANFSHLAQHQSGWNALTFNPPITHPIIYLLFSLFNLLISLDRSCATIVSFTTPFTSM